MERKMWVKLIKIDRNYDFLILGPKPVKTHKPLLIADWPLHYLLETRISRNKTSEILISDGFSRVEWEKDYGGVA